MARRRGFFAELQHQAAVAERNRQRQAAANYRAFQQHQRQAERLAAAARRARYQAARADVRVQAAAEKEAQRLYAEARAAEAEAMTAEAEVLLKEVDDILLATLEVDDYVDLETLRSVVQHPSFESPHAKAPAPPSPRAQVAQPIYVGPTVTGKRTGRRAEESARADRAFMGALYAWWDEAFTIQREHNFALQRFAKDEEARLSRLAADRDQYQQDCQRREAEDAQRNRELDDLIRGLAADEPAAVREYFGIVLENSAYPECLEVGYGIHVDMPNHELAVALVIPPPGSLPVAKGYKYTRTKDEIIPVAQTQAEQKQRYATMLTNVAIRTIHELCEADREGRIQTLSLTAGVAHIDAATGHETITTLLAAAVARDEFDTLNLSRVDSFAALQHFGAVVSKNPWSLTPIPAVPGVRTR